MASLLERMDISSGPIRTKNRVNRSASAPYNRSNRPPKGNSDDAWSHDMFEAHTSLSARLGMNIVPKPQVNFSGMQRALRDAVGNPSELSIKGAALGNVVQVSGLLEGTTAEDVQTIFKKCGTIVQSSVASKGRGGVVVRLKFDKPKSAEKAVEAFHGQNADGRTLQVQIVGVEPSTTALAGRLGGPDGLDIVRGEGSVDVLIGSGSGASKMRSDLLTSDPRAQVLVAPPGANPSEYSQASARGGRPRRGGGRGRGNRRGGRSKMQVD